MSPGSDTRETIVEEARKLFAERGYDGATIGEIARRAGIAEGTIYRHFDSKEELFFACLNPAIEDAYQMMVPQLSKVTDIRDYVRKAVQLHLQLYRKHLDSFNILFSEAPYHPELAGLLAERLLARTQESIPAILKVLEGGGQVSRKTLAALSLSMDVMVWAIVSLGEKFGDTLERVGLPLSRRTLVDDITNFVLYGLIGRPPEDEKPGGEK